MGTEHIAESLNRARAVFARRAAAAIHEDSAATAKWRGGLRFETVHPSGQSVVSDMPTEFGGSGEELTPGWFARAGAAACTATCIGMVAAAQGVELTALEVRVSSRSDARGSLGMRDDRGERVEAAAFDFRLRVLISARHASKAQLEQLVAEGYRCSPVAQALARTNPISVEVVEASD